MPTWLEAALPGPHNVPKINGSKKKPNYRSTGRDYGEVLKAEPGWFSMLIVVTFRRCRIVLAREETMCPRPVLLTATAFVVDQVTQARHTVGSWSGGESVIRNGSSCSSVLISGLEASVKNFLIFPKQQNLITTEKQRQDVVSCWSCRTSNIYTCARQSLQ